MVHTKDKIMYKIIINSITTERGGNAQYYRGWSPDEPLDIPLDKKLLLRVPYGLSPERDKFLSEDEIESLIDMRYLKLNKLTNRVDWSRKKLDLSDKKGLPNLFMVHTKDKLMQLVTSSRKAHTKRLGVDQFNSEIWIIKVELANKNRTDQDGYRSATCQTPSARSQRSRSSTQR